MRKNYTPGDEADWEAAFVAPLAAEVPRALAGLRLDQALVRLFPQYSRNRLQAWLRAGHVRVEGAPARASVPVAGGERIALAPPPAPDAAHPPAQKMRLRIVYEDDDVIVIDKPAGLVVHPGAGNPEGTLLNALLAHAPGLRAVPRAGIVHRLDKDTSGLVVVAKNVAAQARLAAQLAARSVRRRYLALVEGDPPAAGTIEAPIGRDRRARTRMTVAQGGKPALTRYRVLERFGHAALIECTLETGRTHQIRVHLQHIRHPLVGDPVYRRGTRHRIPFARQALHAETLEFDHPASGRRMRFRAPLPADLKRLLAQLRRDA
ncbi:MAG: RluA family pseudouridine synthase [Burkholderiales bacterium]|nr:RluA family pseudouridine synthase [Burkholderiales bacterium]